MMEKIYGMNLDGKSQRLELGKLYEVVSVKQTSVMLKGFYRSFDMTDFVFYDSNYNRVKKGKLKWLIG